MKLLLWDLRSPMNIGMILRTAEIYGWDTIVHDPAGITTQPAKLTVISDFACGALERRGLARFDDNHASWESLKGRLIGTSIDPGSEPMPGFQWQPDDILLIGNEYYGVPAAVAARASRMVTIPMPKGHFPKPASTSPIDAEAARLITNEGTPSLNVAVATSILVVSAYCQQLESLSVHG